MAHVGAALLRRPGRTLAGVVFAGLLCGVVANALFFQTARHPAPIFHAPVATRAAQPVAAPMPVPPPRPVEKSAPAQAQAGAAPVPPVAVASRAAEAPTRDQIGALLSGGSAPTSAPNETARVAAAQKALVKLGYVVKADGIMGAGTRKAIEMFEQSRKLPVTGELSPRVTRELSALSGVPVP